jgi:outer membrane receptor protein involved in Fe transport
LAAESFKTDGYVIVAEGQRGRVDTPANSRDLALDFKLQFEKTKDSRFFIGTSYFGESRHNGTPQQINRTHIRQITSGTDWSSKFGVFDLRGYYATQVFDQTFSAVAADRNSETLTRVQRVPAQVAGVSLQWSRSFGTKHTMVSGLEAREVRGASDELVFTQGRPSTLVGAGGRERELGLYIKDLLRVTPRFSVVAGARIDHWRDFAAHADTRPLSPGTSSKVELFADRSEPALSPQFSLIFKPEPKVAVFGSVYRAFRAPTLNELYRSFRVGNVLTQANETLRSERLFGGEGGASLASLDGRFYLRASFFWSETSKPIANVTLSAAPELILRKRQNLGRTRARGVEIETNAQLGGRWRVSGSYLLADSRVVEFPVDQSLEGLAVPQIPRQSLAVQLRYTNSPKLGFSLQGRMAGRQFDDDLNLFPLPGYFTLDALASRSLTHNVELFAAVENVFNQRYVVGRTPITTLGPPLLIRAGFRLRLTK